MGCNPDILENICPSGLRPSGLYFPIYPDYNPCIISICLDFQCDDTTCPPSQGSCQNETKEDLKFQMCKCKGGYQGENCIDIDECKISDWCKNKGVCTNDHGSFTCDCKNSRFEGSEFCDKPKYSEYVISFNLNF